MPRLSKCIETLGVNELFRIHKHQFEDTADSGNTAHTAGKNHPVKEKSKRNSIGSSRNPRGRNKCIKTNRSVQVLRH